jgi:hypothetical protein
MPDKEVLEMCQMAIKKDLGNLDDLPHELGNTIANVYYRYFEHSLDVIKRGNNNPGWIPKEVKQDSDLLRGMGQFAENIARFKSDVQSAPKFIEGLREIDKHKQPNLYQMTVDIILDVLKYDLNDVFNKTGIRRMIERKFKKSAYKEIPNLTSLLNF